MLTSVIIGTGLILLLRRRGPARHARDARIGQESELTRWPGFLEAWCLNRSARLECAKRRKQVQISDLLAVCASTPNKCNAKSRSHRLRIAQEKSSAPILLAVSISRERSSATRCCSVVSARRSVTSCPAPMTPVTSPSRPLWRLRSLHHLEQLVHAVRAAA